MKRETAKIGDYDYTGISVISLSDRDTDEFKDPDIGDFIDDVKEGTKEIIDDVLDAFK